MAHDNGPHIPVTPSTIETLRGFARAGLLPMPDVEAIARRCARPAATEPPALMTVRAAAQRLGCCSRTVLRLANEGRVRRVFLRPGSRKTLRIVAEDVNAIASGTCASQESDQP